MAIDENKGWVFVALSDAGVALVDNRTTLNQSDDVVIGTYSTTSAPALPSNDVKAVEYDPVRYLLYIGFWGAGVSVINTQGTTSMADDVLVFTYNTGSSPAITSNYVRDDSCLLLDLTNNLIYIATWEYGVSVINTQGTITPSDDTLVRNFSPWVAPALGHKYTNALTLDLVNNVLYVGAWNGGLTAIDLKNPLSGTDDVLIKRYYTNTTPAICDTWGYRKQRSTLRQVCFILVGQMGVFQ